MPSINKVTLLGNLGRDPEMKYTQTGKSICNFSMATTESWKDQSGNWKNKTEWHNVQVWGKLAEICGERLYKGDMVYVEGKVQTRSWEDNDGAKRYKTEIVAREVKFFTSKGDNGSSGSSDGYNSPGADAQDDDIPF